MGIYWPEVLRYFVTSIDDALMFVVLGAIAGSAGFGLIKLVARRVEPLRTNGLLFLGMSTAVSLVVLALVATYLNAVVTSI